jgi:hypothetical protein
MVEGPKITMHARHDSIEDIKARKNNWPGAGTYDTQNFSNPNMRKGP